MLQRSGFQLNSQTIEPKDPGSSSSSDMQVQVPRFDVQSQVQFQVKGSSSSSQHAG